MKNISDHLISYRAFLANEQRQISAQIEQMESQNRQDEANLQKIRLNIVQVFETVANADEKQCADWPSFQQRYANRFDTLTAPWRARLAAAKHHNDILVQTVEEEKLSMANQIKNAFLSLGA